MGRGTLLKVRDRSGNLPDVQDRLGDLLGGLGRVWRSFRRFGSGRVVLPKVRDRRRGPPIGPGRVWKSSRRSGMGREVLQKCG